MDKNTFNRIVASFTRAFIGGLTVSQAINFNDLRGWEGVVGSAVIAGIAAALRTVEATITGSTPDDLSDANDE